jgi:hypothetical protein
MFKQIKDLAGDEFYLITSLIMFMLFFLLVGLYLFKMSKTYTTLMSNIPLKDQQAQEYEEH